MQVCTCPKPNPIPIRVRGPQPVIMQCANCGKSVRDADDEDAKLWWLSTSIHSRIEDGDC